MFDRVLVGVDGSAGGKDAISLAKELAAENAHITLAHVCPGESFVWRGGNPGYWPVDKEQVVAMLEAARSDAQIDADLRYAVLPPTGRRLHEMAEEIKADLLVIGSSRRGLVGSVLVGDVTRAALNGAPCAVAVAPVGYANARHSLRRIGVGYDGSAQSTHALATARDLARDRGALLSAFEIVSIPARTYVGMGDPEEVSVEALADAARIRLARLGGLDPHAAYGDPAEELASYSGSLDLLVVGSRDYGPVGRLVHGSTAQALARRCRCPLLVLTRAARGADAVKMMTRMAAASKH